jgi:hypothetical protein
MVVCRDGVVVGNIGILYLQSLGLVLANAANNLRIGAKSVGQSGSNALTLKISAASNPTGVPNL